MPLAVTNISEYKNRVKDEFIWLLVLQHILVSPKQGSLYKQFTVMYNIDKGTISMLFPNHSIYMNQVNYLSKMRRRCHHKNTFFSLKTLNPYNQITFFPI